MDGIHDGIKHARVFFFMNHGGKPKFFIGSADWRSRNLISRVEVVTPIEVGNMLEGCGYEQSIIGIVTTIG